METISQQPISYATSVLKKLLMTEIHRQKLPFRDFKVSTDHPNNVSDQGTAILNLYPFLINEDNALKNARPLREQDSRQGNIINVHFLLSALGDYAELTPHRLLDSALRIIKASPVLDHGKDNFTLQIMLVAMDIERESMIWSTLKCPHRPNIVVLVKIVNKESSDLSLDVNIAV